MFAGGPYKRQNNLIFAGELKFNTEVSIIFDEEQYVQKIFPNFLSDLNDVWPRFLPGFHFKAFWTGDWRDSYLLKVDFLIHLTMYRDLKVIGNDGDEYPF